MLSVYFTLFKNHEAFLINTSLVDTCFYEFLSFNNTYHNIYRRTYMKPGICFTIIKEEEGR